MSLFLTGNEITQFQYILPVQGSLQTLELIQSILDKIKVSDLEESYEIDFTDNELNLIKQSIEVLNKNHQLHIQSLSLINKILKQEKN